MRVGYAITGLAYSTYDMDADAEGASRFKTLDFCKVTEYLGSNSSMPASQPNDSAFCASNALRDDAGGEGLDVSSSPVGVTPVVGGGRSRSNIRNDKVCDSQTSTSCSSIRNLTTMPSAS